jgi:hypothetical protein
MRRRGNRDGLSLTDRMIVSWSSVVTRVELGEVKLGHKWNLWREGVLMGALYRVGRRW